MSEPRLGKLIGKAVHVEYEPLEKVSQRGVETARRVEAGIKDVFDAYNRGEINWDELGYRTSLVQAKLDKPVTAKRSLVVFGVNFPLPPGK